MNIFLILITLTFTACSTPFFFKYHSLKIDEVKGYSEEEKDYSKVATGKRIFDGDPEPVWPGSKNHDTLEGIDSDNDGIRDDVEIWINEEHKDRNSRLALKQYAKAEIMYLLWEKSGMSSKAAVYFKKLLPANECVNAVADTGYLSNLYLGQMIEHGNSERTDKRVKDENMFLPELQDADERFKRLGDPWSMSASEGVKWKMKFCDFEIDNKQRYIDEPYFFKKRKQ
ncbi:MAG: hypothetical protein HYV97_12270 [Bdellovibrio sp.]|nr:hypothetical protein [Bdellovibrio sp.]